MLVWLEGIFHGEMSEGSHQTWCGLPGNVIVRIAAFVQNNMSSDTQTATLVTVVLLTSLVGLDIYLLSHFQRVNTPLKMTIN